MIEYRKMSLFDAPKGSVLVHACNSKGVWGSGIAVEFKNRFPTAFKEYEKYCRDFGLVGTAQLIPQPGWHKKDYFIVNLITSSGYAGTLDPKDVILVNTTLALQNLCSNLWGKGLEETQIYSNKFNSGLFRVPWEETERILKVFVERYSLNWTVCDFS